MFWIVWSLLYRHLNILCFVCRDEIAGCIEKAYEQIQFNEATRVLFFSSPKKMTEYAKKVSVQCVCQILASHDHEFCAV